MPDNSKQESMVLITNKNGRLDFEINQQATENICAGIVISDLYGYISDVNDRLVEIFGAKDKSEFVGKHLLEFLVKEEKARVFQNSLALILLNNQKITGQYKVHLKSGEVTTLEVTTTLMKDKDGQSVGFIDFVKKVN